MLRDAVASSNSGDGLGANGVAILRVAHSVVTLAPAHGAGGAAGAVGTVSEGPHGARFT